MNALECSTALDGDTTEIQVYLGGTDEDREGVFTTWYTRELIKVKEGGLGKTLMMILLVSALGTQQTIQ